MPDATVLGVGAMGSRMAASLLRAGYRVTVWNRSKDKASPLLDAGAMWADTPREACENVGFAIAMVRDDEASREVWLHPDHGAAAGMGKDAIAIESSTLTPAFVKELATDMSRKNIAFLDAPVSGSLPQAEAGQLIYLVGGEADTVAIAEPVLKAMGAAIHYAGPSGSGAILKLAVNALLGVQLAAMAELIGFLEKAGLNPETAVDILGSTPVCSPAAKGLAALMLSGKFSPAFPVELIAKDFNYALATARTNGAQLPLAEATRTVIQTAIGRGFAEENMTSLVKLYR